MSGPWQALEDLFIRIDDGQSTIRGVVKLAGLDAAFKEICKRVVSAHHDCPRVGINCGLPYRTELIGIKKSKGQQHADLLLMSFFFRGIVNHAPTSYNGSDMIRAFRPRKEKPRPRVPEGVRIYAIGDIHGRADLLEQMLNRIDADLASNPIPTGIQVFLGAYSIVDRLHAKYSTACWRATVHVGQCFSKATTRAI